MDKVLSMAQYVAYIQQSFTKGERYVTVTRKEGLTLDRFHDNLGDAARRVKMPWRFSLDRDRDVIIVQSLAMRS